MDSHIHSNEDMSKPENRTNLAFFSTLMIPEIHSFVCDRLELPKDVTIFPSPNLVTEESGSTVRPDFKITKSYPGRAIGYLEIELGKEDGAQVQKYNKELGVPVYSIVGKKSYRQNGRSGDLSLEEIYYWALKVIESRLNSQQHASLDLFCTLVKRYVIDGNFHASNKRCDISEEISNSPLMRKVYSYFGEPTILRNARIERGKILLNTISENGFSLRVYCTQSRNKTFSLMCRTAGKKEIEFPSLCKLRKYFPSKKRDTEFLAGIIAQLGADEIHRLPEKGRAKLPIKKVEDNFERIGDALKRFLLQ